MNSYSNTDWAGIGAIHGFILGALFKIYQNPLSDYPFSLSLLVAFQAVMPAIVAYPLSRISPDIVRFHSPPVTSHASGFMAGFLAGLYFIPESTPSSRMSR